MTRLRGNTARLLASAAAALGLLAVGAPAQAHPRLGPGHPHERVCGSAARGYAHCDADVVTDGSGAPLTATGPLGYWPSDLQDAYGLTALAAAGSGRTIAIVDAYDQPSAEADMNVYRSRFGLPPCTTANGCFRKVNQSGGTSSYPPHDASWGLEISLDLDMTSAICPHCKILLVEAKSNSMGNLGAAVNTAAALGATQISNSYGGGEAVGVSALEPYFDHPGVAITASSGDSGYGVEYPAASAHVTAVGGTSLAPDSSARGWSETAWSGAGSGCSIEIPKPSWQTDTGCGKRTVADVSAVADPATGVSVYDSDESPPWVVLGGTSAAAPIVAAAYALIGSSAGAGNASYAYSHTGNFFDVTLGANGSCGLSYLCTAGAGFDGPTGFGSPNATDIPVPADEGGSPPPTVETPAASAPPASTTSTPAAAGPIVKISRRALRLRRGGRIAVGTSCAGSRTCTGKLTLALSRVLVGSGTIAVAPGRMDAVRVRLSRRARSLLKPGRRLRLTATATSTAGGLGDTAALTVRAPRRRRQL